MIAAVAAVIGGLIAGIKTPLLSPALYLLRSRRDLFLLSYVVFCLALGYEFEVANVYDADLIAIFAAAMPTILLLDAGLRDDEKDGEKGLRGLIAYVAVLAMLAGLFINVAFIFGLLIAFLHHFQKDRPGRGAVVAIISISLLILGLFAGREMLNLPGAASSQVVFISAVGILLGLFFWKSIKTTEFLS
jgi:hypothetical protein